MTKILHTADWQIGRQYSAFEPEDAAALADARFAAVERLADLAATTGVDVVLVAGDVFDAQGVSPRTIRRLFNAMAGFTGPWVMIPGNHDAALAEGVWRLVQRLDVLPVNVHLALEPKVVELAELRLAVLCAPLTQRHTYGDLTDWFDERDTPDGWLRIGMAHGAVQGVLADDIDSANPIAADRATTARLDYLALGDWHGCKQIDARTWYSGTPEPDRFKDNDAGHALRVDLDGPGVLPRVTRHRIARHRWRQLRFDVQVDSDVQQVITGLAACDAGDVVDLEVSGHVDLVGHGRIAAALAEAEGVVRCLRSDLTGLRLMPTPDDIAALQADGYLGEVITDLRDAVGEQAACAQDALAILTALLAERQRDVAAQPAVGKSAAGTISTAVAR